MNKLFLIISAFLLSFSPPAKAIEINQQQYCYLTIQQPDQSTFKIHVPHDRVKTISNQLNVIGINCRGHN